MDFSQCQFERGFCVIPDLAVGAVIAALIGATISLVGLIVAKESKVSEFRQTWIDSLRGELSAFLASANSVANAQKINFENDKERLEFLQPIYEKLNETYYSIALRLNSTELDSKNLQICMVNISEYINNKNDLEFLKFNSHRVEFLKISNSLLKKEWSRVKSGEPTYRAARLIAGIATALLVAAAVFLSLNSTPSIAKIEAKENAKALTPLMERQTSPQKSKSIELQSNSPVIAIDAADESKQTRRP